MEEWYYALNAAQQGPVSREVLLRLLGSRQLPPASLVWREGMTAGLPMIGRADKISSNHQLRIEYR